MFGFENLPPPSSRPDRFAGVKGRLKGVTNSVGTYIHMGETHRGDDEGTKVSTGSKSLVVSELTESGVGGVSKPTGSDVRGVSKSTGSDVRGIRKSTESNVRGVSKSTGSDVRGVRKSTESNVRGIRKSTESNVRGVSKSTEINVRGVSKSTGNSGFGESIKQKRKVSY